jgi:4-aminobutyrate aminotransferase
MDDLTQKARRLLTPALLFHTELVVAKAEGAYVEMTNGKRYLDFSSGVATTNIGHCHPKVLEAVSKQTERLIHAGGVYLHEPLIEAAEAIKGITPPGLDMFFFSNSGAEAVEGAIKLARHWTGKQGIIAFTGAFHGRSLGALSLTSSTVRYRKDYSPFLPSIYYAPYPYCYRCPMGKRKEDCSLECFGYLKDIVLRHLIHPDEVAAFIVEPVQGEGGYIVPHPEFIKELRDLCSRHGILLILDEVQTGIGRTARWFASEHFGIIPDIITIAKAIASGLPLSAVISTKEIMEKWPPGAHGTTFGGNPVSCAAAVATLKVIKEEGLLKKADALSQKAINRLKGIKEGYKAIGDVRGLGLMIGIEFVRDEKEPDQEAVKRVIKGCLDRGLILIECGGDKNVIRFIPPLIITEEEMDRALDVFEEAVRSL